MKRKPTASDRNVSDALFHLKPGKYEVTVESTFDRIAGIAFLGKARLKNEGGMLIARDGTEINFNPMRA